MSTPDEWQPVLFTLVNGGYAPDSDNFFWGACTPSSIVQPRRLTLQVIPPSDVKSCGFWESGGRTKVRIMNDTFWFLGELAFVCISRTSNRFTWMKQTMPVVPWLNLVAPFTCRANPIQFSTPRTQWHTFVTALIRGKNSHPRSTDQDEAAMPGRWHFGARLGTKTRIWKSQIICRVCLPHPEHHLRVDQLIKIFPTPTLLKENGNCEAANTWKTRQWSKKNENT